MKRLLRSLILLYLIVSLAFLSTGLIKSHGSIYPQRDFSDYKFDIDLVNVVMTKGASRLFKNYTPADFADFGVTNITDLSKHTIDYVRHTFEQTHSSNGDFRETTTMINLENFQRILTLTIDNGSRERVLDVIRLLNMRDDVYVAEPNFIFEFSSVPGYTQSWLSPMRNQIGYNHLNAFQEGVPSIKVGVIDTGIDSFHPDLHERIYRSQPHNINTTLHRCFVKNQSVTDPKDEFTSGNIGHGTQVAGIIVGMHPNVELISLRVGISDLSPNHTVSAIKYASMIGIPILNFSGDGYGRSEIILSALNQFYGLFVTAAGNRGKTVDHQAHMSTAGSALYNQIIRVGAIDNNGNRSIWNASNTNPPHQSSNFGNRVHVYAPGGSTMADDDRRIRAPKPGGGFGFAWGTSTASAFVAGTAALMWSLNPSLTPSQIRSRIINGSNDINVTIPLWHNYVIIGHSTMTARRLNAFRVVSEIALDTVNIDNEKYAIFGSITPLSGSFTIPSMLHNRIVSQVGGFAYFTGTCLFIPASIQTIFSSAFENSNNLRRISFMSNDPPTIKPWYFISVNRSLIRLYIPQGSRDLFLSRGWTGFQFIEQVNIRGAGTSQIGTQNIINLNIPATMSGVHYEIISGNATLVHISNERAIVTPLSVGNIIVRASIDGVTFTHTINVVVRPPCICIPNPDILQRCCCADWGEWCFTINPLEPGFDDYHSSCCC